jgi:hypothetical protein
MPLLHRHANDASHRGASRALSLVQSALPEDEWRDFYLEVVPLFRAAIAEYVEAVEHERGRVGVSEARKEEEVPCRETP